MPPKDGRETGDDTKATSPETEPKPEAEPNQEAEPKPDTEPESDVTEIAQTDAMDSLRQLIADMRAELGSLREEVTQLRAAGTLAQSLADEDGEGGSSEAAATEEYPMLDLDELNRMIGD